MQAMTAQVEGRRNAQPAGAATFNIVADAHADLIVRVAAALNLLNVATPGGTSLTASCSNSPEFARWL